jgi:hypothetical protein
VLGNTVNDDVRGYIPPRHACQCDTAVHGDRDHVLLDSACYHESAQIPWIGRRRRLVSLLEESARRVVLLESARARRQQTRQSFLENSFAGPTSGAKEVVTGTIARRREATFVGDSRAERRWNSCRTRGAKAFRVSTNVGASMLAFFTLFYCVTCSLASMNLAPASL